MGRSGCEPGRSAQGLGPGPRAALALDPSVLGWGEGGKTGAPVSYLLATVLTAAARRLLGKIKYFFSYRINACQL